MSMFQHWDLHEHFLFISESALWGVEYCHDAHCTFQAVDLVFVGVVFVLSIRIACLWAEIFTQDFSNTMQVC
jgi:hypothetical protein